MRCFDHFCDEEALVHCEGFCQVHFDVYQTFRCPECGFISWPDSGCPTYANGDGTWMRCYPSCGNATEWECTNDDCDWSYLEWTNNPNKNVGKIRPHWMFNYMDSLWDE